MRNVVQAEFENIGVGCGTLSIEAPSTWSVDTSVSDPLVINTLPYYIKDRWYVLISLRENTSLIVSVREDMEQRAFVVFTYTSEGVRAGLIRGMQIKIKEPQEHA